MTVGEDGIVRDKNGSQVPDFTSLRDFDQATNGRGLYIQAGLNEGEINTELVHSMSEEDKSLMLKRLQYLVLLETTGWVKERETQGCTKCRPENYA
jgi:hypothetical protein